MPPARVSLNLSRHFSLSFIPFKVISSSCNALVVSFQLLLEGIMEVILCERVNDLRQSLFHLLNCLITTASVTESRVWTIGRLNADLGQIACDKDGVVDWCIVLLEMTLTRFEECWPLPRDSLLELP